MIKPSSTALRVHDLSVTFTDADGTLHALDNVSFSIQHQEFVCVLGASGAGKSTLLRALAGLVQPTHGGIEYAGGRKPRIGMVFQDSNLMPWRSVLANISLPMEIEGVSQSTAATRAQQLVELVGLQGFEQAWPRTLSGGMAQRVAIARALAQDPDVLLLDEPFGALDALTRERMELELSRIWQGQRKTVIMVTHSIGESLFLADRVLVLSQRPGTVRLDLKVDLPRPRNTEVRYTEKFGRLARRLRAALE